MGRASASEQTPGNGRGGSMTERSDTDLRLFLLLFVKTVACQPSSGKLIKELVLLYSLYRFGAFTHIKSGVSVALITASIVCASRTEV